MLTLDHATRLAYKATNGTVVEQAMADVLATGMISPRLRYEAH